MIGGNFYFWLFTLLISYIYSEVFFSILVGNSFKNIKFFSNKITKSNNIVIFKQYIYIILIYLFISFLLTIKVSLNNTLFSLLIIYSIITQYIYKYYNNYINFLTFNTIIFLFYFFFVNNFIIFYLFIELYAILFYFFFLNVNYNSKQLYLIQYKNSILLYLFNNFLTSIIYLIGISYIIYLKGTLNFLELTFFNNVSIEWQIYLIILSFIIKLSLPGYHFLKIEIYKYLNLDVVIMFSIITLYINFMFTIFLFNQNIIFFTLNSYKFMNLLILMVFFFFIHKLKLNNFQEFISYSGFATNNLIILNFLV